MMQRMPIFIVFFLFSIEIFSNELYTFGRNSDRSDNSYIITILKNSNLEDCVQLLKGTSTRDDYYIADILSYLATFAKGNFVHEYLLRVTLQCLFNPALNDDQMLFRIEANRSILVYFFQNLGFIKDFQLKSILIDLFAYLQPHEFESILFTELQSLLNYLQEHNMYDPDIKAELLSILNIINLSKNPAFIDLLIEVIKAVPDKFIIEKTRKTLKIVIKNNT